MKAVSIIGYKNSGKSTLVRLLADEFERRGQRVAIAKHTHHGLDKDGTDTASFAGKGRTVIGLGPEETAIFWGEKRHLVDLLPLVQADILLVEGGKELKWLPRVLCLTASGDAEALDKGLAIATYGDVAAPYLTSFGTGDVEKLAERINEQGFMLPGLDCGACGEEGCGELSARIVAGGASVRDCSSVSESFSVTVNGQPIGMNPFVERILRSGIMGMLQELKGFAPGDVEISIKG